MKHFWYILTFPLYGVVSTIIIPLSIFQFSQAYKTTRDASLFALVIISLLLWVFLYVSCIYCYLIVKRVHTCAGIYSGILISTLSILPKVQKRICLLLYYAVYSNLYLSMCLFVSFLVLGGLIIFAIYKTKKENDK